MLVFNCSSAEKAIQKRNCNFVNKYMYANADNLCVLYVRRIATCASMIVV